jgi:hypothetical protein
LAFLVPVLTLPALYLLPCNPIYPAIVAKVLGAAATVACLVDLKWSTLIGGMLFAAYYAAFMLLLEWSVPGYIARVWNLPALSGHRDRGHSPGRTCVRRYLRKLLSRYIRAFNVDRVDQVQVTMERHNRMNQR